MLVRLLSLIKKLFKKAQPIKSWAFLIWAFALCNLSATSLIDGSFESAVVVALTVSLAPLNLIPVKRFALLGLSACLLFLGPPAVVVITPITLLITGFMEQFVLSGLVLVATGLLLPQTQSINFTILGWIPLASLTFTVLPTILSTVILRSILTKSQKIRTILAGLLVLGFVGLASAHWIDASFLTNPYCRLVLALLPIVSICLNPSNTQKVETAPLIPFFTALIIGCLATIIIPTHKIKSIAFDEAHGKWETVQSKFTPDDFGRNANYTYSQLYSYAGSIVSNAYVYNQESEALPDKDALFVVKMPATPLSEGFAKKLAEWVQDGGRLLVVADHTDLYDTTQNINQLLVPYFGTKINSDAVYDFEGMPNNPYGYWGNIFLGKINSNGNKFPWQTGSSFNYVPANSIELTSFGLSFAEYGDYARPNRFGPFVPTIKNKFMAHSSTIAFSSGKGAVSVILDSTPWSNFSIFIDQYKHLFKSLVTSLELPNHLKLLGISGYSLLLLSIVFYLIPSRLSYPLAGFILGATLSIAAQIGVSSISKIEYGRDYELKVVLGKESKLEFLRQLINPGEQNFSRIISAMGKYSLKPIATAPGSQPGALSTSKRWLFINPDSKQLPNLEELVACLSSGGNVTILFSKHQAPSKEILDWLNNLSLFTKNNIGLKVSDSSKSLNGSYLNGRTPALGREINVVAIAKPTSFFNSLESDDLMQTFTLRPTKVPRTSGELNISFAAEQFSDDAIGDVWEGVDPSSIGALREQQLAAVILNKDRPNQFPQSLITPSPTKTQKLRNYLVVQDGETKIYGKLPFHNSQDPVEVKFQNLRALAEAFVETTCPATAKLTKCKSRLLDSSYVEWIVSWKSDNLGGIASIELVHDRRMSGLGSSWNVIFGN